MSAAALDLSPLSPVMGVAITGEDLSRPLTPAFIARARQAFLDHHVVVFRDQRLSAENMYNLAAIFGEVEQHKVRQEDGSRWDAVHQITNLDASGQPVEKPFFSSTYFWHTDKSFLTEPALLTMLHAVELPPKGGDTQFANMTRAYDALSDTMKQRLDGRRAIQSLAFMRRYTGSAPATEDDIAAAPPVAHPVVRTHPETGRKSLYIGMYCAHIEGLPEAEGRQLLEDLLAHATEERFVYSHAWQPGDLMFWDNRCLLHRAVANYEMGRHRRVLMRVVVKGTRPQ